MNATSRKSTRTSLALGEVARACQVRPNSSTHGPAILPSSLTVLAPLLSLTVILSILLVRSTLSCDALSNAGHMPVAHASQNTRVFVLKQRHLVRESGGKSVSEVFQIGAGDETLFRLVAKCSLAVEFPTS